MNPGISSCSTVLFTLKLSREDEDDVCDVVAGCEGGLVCHVLQMEASIGADAGVWAAQSRAAGTPGGRPFHELRIFSAP